jgi:hypothetical protein
VQPGPAACIYDESDKTLNSGVRRKPPAEVRQNMIQKIGDLGGKYSPSLNRECTHLVVAHPKPDSAGPDPLASAKVRWAFQVNAQAREEREHWALQEDAWRRRGGGVGENGIGMDMSMAGRDKERERGIKVVWEGWFWDCLQFDGRFKEDAWNAEEVSEPPGYEQSYRYRGEQRVGASGRCGWSVDLNVGLELGL